MLSPASIQPAASIVGLILYKRLTCYNSASSKVGGTDDNKVRWNREKEI